MAQLRIRARSIPLILALWTLFVWGGRLRNLGNDPAGFDGASAWSLFGSVAFVVLAVAVLVALTAVAVDRASPSGSLLRVTVAVLGGFTIVVWLIRGLDIAVGDHSVGFIAVHVVLALVSAVLSVLAVRQVFQTGAGSAPIGAVESGRSSVG